jgi:phosphoglycerate dehydrogenase-like enzyme
MPALRAILHAAGSVKGFLAPEVWSRGILVTTAADANARPVAEYTLAAILLAGKDIPALAAEYARDPSFRVTPGRRTVTGESATANPGWSGIGNYGRTVGIIGASRVGRQVIDLLGPFDFQVLLYDPRVRADDPVPRRVERTGLADLLRRSSIVSIHAPLLPETRGMLGSRQLALMRPGSVLINTARGGIVDHDALAGAVRDGGLRAILDVTSPEPLPADHPLRGLPGVILTPHVAGSLGNELRRLGQSVTTELELFAAGQPARSAVHEQSLITMA